MYIIKLKNIRINNDYAQKEIANVLGVKRGTYASWECGSDTIPTKQLYNLAEFYSLNIDYILNIDKKHR